MPLGSAEIVEEGRGWFHLSAGFEINGEPFELQPILAALVENRFLEVTEGLPALRRDWNRTKPPD